MTPRTKETSLRLNLIRLLTSNPDGLTLEELSKASGIRSEAELKKSLGKLYMVGTYPYSPLDYLELDTDGNRIKLLFPQNPNKTIALRSTEWLILRDSLLSEWDRTTEPIRKRRIENILKKIKSIVPFENIAEYENLKKSIQVSIQESKVLSFRYSTKPLVDENSTNQEAEFRTIEPWYLWDERQIHSRAYLIGYCRTRLSPRVFRLDQISGIEMTKESFHSPNQEVIESTLREFQDFLSKSEETGETAVLWHTRKSHYYLNQTLRVTTTGESKKIDGVEFIRSECKIREKNWFLDIIIGFLPDLILESPQSLVEDLRNRISLALKDL